MVQFNALWGLPSGVQNVNWLGNKLRCYKLQDHAFKMLVSWRDENLPIRNNYLEDPWTNVYLSGPISAEDIAVNEKDSVFHGNTNLIEFKVMIFYFMK